MKILIIRFVVMSLLAISTCSQANDEKWNDWEQFKTVYISTEGRVIDGSNPQLITTSEGQAYGMLFALMSNDKNTFRLLLNWTEANLANNDLTINLPAWLWGFDKEKQIYSVLDTNSASDADLWIAYALTEAGRIWNEYHYKSLGYLLAQNILKKEAVQIPNYGWMILPGSRGFQSTTNSWRLNPSYLPLQILRRFEILYPHSQWHEIKQNTVNFLKQSEPTGFAPEWSIVNDNNQVFNDDVNNTKIGGYNAIRVYLWLGMLSNDDPDKQSLMAHYSPMLKVIQQDAFVAEQYDTALKVQSGYHPIGFHAAVLPFLVSANDVLTTTNFLNKVTTTEPSTKPDYYYDSVLKLFGKGWLEHKYEFNQDGLLMINPPINNKP